MNSSTPQLLNSLTDVPVVLTDSPRVVRLKREFSYLAGREEELRPHLQHPAAAEELEKVRARKSAIAAEVFKA
jgi:hypothetical protein